MTDYAKTAAGVLTGVGGEENVQSLVHCATRLRFVLKDDSKADAAALKAVPGVITTTQAGGQYQVVIGNDVPEVFAEIGRISKFGGSGDAPAAEAGPKGNLFNRFISMISSIFTPALWALAGTGLLKAFLAAAVTFGWISTETSTYVVLNALSDAFIFFLPIVLAITAARYFKASEFTSLAIAGALVYPTITALVGAPDLTFFGIPFTMVTYVSSVIPIIVAVWVQSHMERFLYAKLHASVRRFVTPMIVVLVIVPLIFVVIGPISAVISGWLGGGIGWVFATVPWLGGAIMGGLWQVFVIFGLHWGLVPLFTLEFQTTGQILLIGPIFAAVLAQAAAVAGVWVRARNKSLKSLRRPGHALRLPRRHHRARHLRHQPAPQAPLRVRHRRRRRRRRHHRDRRRLLDRVRGALDAGAARPVRKRQHDPARHRPARGDPRPVPAHRDRRLQGARRE